MKRGFDAGRYIEAQTAEILKRVRRFDRLYLEFGGKLTFDDHAARVLPGYKKTTKIDLLKELGDLRIVYCVSARALEMEAYVGTYDMTHAEKALQDLRALKKFGFENIDIVITRFSNEKKAKEFGAKVRKMGKKVYFHSEIEGYGENITATLRGYARQELVEIKEDLIIITGPGSGSGKMGFALSQIYKERKRASRRPKAEGRTGFAKFETFPIWNLPIKHPVNLAYEAATADIGDYNMIDPFHLKAYGKRAVNYNRDVENFEILVKLMRGVSQLDSKHRTGQGGQRFPFGYKSPTDMGVSMAKVGIVDDEVCRRAGVAEIRKRLAWHKKAGDEEEVLRIEKVLRSVR
ncbi:DUF1846 family protein [Methanococcoides sp. SA1]|nr:DUF1846 family protein [Methanococcoides sp. SA1]